MQNIRKFVLGSQRLSSVNRFLIIISSFIIIESLVIYALHARGTDRGVSTLLVLTGVLAAWLFPTRLAFALEFSLLIVYLAGDIAILGWNWMLLEVFPIGVFVDLSILATVGFLRQALEREEATRIQEKKLMEVKDQFLSNVNHELRTPLMGVLGSLDILRENGHILSEGERNMFLDQAIFNGGEIERLTWNFIDAMRAESDVPPPWVKAFRLDAIVLDTLRHVDTFGHPLYADVPDAIEVLADSQQVRQVLRNLLSNAFKYAPPGTPVDVSVGLMTPVEHEHRPAYVCVEDKGPGISPEQIPYLFQKFRRLERDVAGSVRGIGLGLYICKRFVENMGGEIWVESTGIDGEGCRFFFTVPCEKKNAQMLKEQKAGRKI